MSTTPAAGVGAVAGTAGAKKDEASKEATAVERVVFVGVLGWLTYKAAMCPCDKIFKCMRSTTLAILGALFTYIFFRTQ